MINNQIEFLYGKAILPNSLTIGSIDYDEDIEEGQWLVLFFIPAAFTWVCPTEFNEIKNLYKDFEALNAVVWGISTDGIEVHQRWIEDAFGSLPFPVLSDRNQELTMEFAELDEENGVSYRCTLIIDGNRRIRHYSANDNNVGRNINEILRLIKAFQESDESGLVAQCGWNPGNDMIKPGE